MYRVEIVWNREFNWVPFGDMFTEIELAKAFASDMKNSGDGARVKKARVVNTETDEVELQNYQIP